MLAGAAAATGTSVIIDVFRAFSCEPILFYLGASEILLEADIPKCLEMRNAAVLVGERDGFPIPGFDISNSPIEALRKGPTFFDGRRVVHRTTAGVTGALAAMEKSEEVLLASFLIAGATAEYIRKKAPNRVSIVAMGTRAVETSPEDEFCAEYIESLLRGRPYNHLGAVREILEHESARKFLRGDASYFPPEDPAICLQRDLFQFAIRAEKQNGYVRAVPITIDPLPSKPRN
jgi:2-phosphosulfolactate phosphatase